MRLYIGKVKAEYRHHDYYELGKSKSWWDPIVGFRGAGCLYDFNMPKEQFERIFGIKLAPGEIRKVKQIIIEVE